MIFEEIYQSRKDKFENFFKTEIYNDLKNSFDPSLAEASIYSLSAGGKRFRPILLISAFLCGNQENEISQNAFFLASALECIHTYSLIHDDLPSMDDDDFRRGIPTLHKKYSESTAILAGDALNSYGFYLCSKVNSIEDHLLTSDILNILHTGGGGPGMVSGQMEDLFNESNTDHFSEKALKSVHEKKTGALIVSSLLMGNRLKPEYEKYESSFKIYGENLGLLFQITDDIIDEEGTFSELGKTPGKDLASGKLTYPALYGMEKSKSLRDEIKTKLEELSFSLSENKDLFFRELPQYIASRKN